MIAEFSDSLAIFGIRDCVEIIIISAAVYVFIGWLAQDRQKKALSWFYGLSGIAVAAGVCKLTTISAIYLACWPVMVLLFIVVHQRTLQKNFVALQNIRPATIPRENWIEALVRSAFLAANNGTELTFYIEQEHSLREHLLCPIPFQALLTHHTMDLIINNHRIDEQTGIWLNTSGELLGINIDWQLPADARHGTWEQKALFVTQYVDSLICKLSQETRTFEIIAQNHRVSDASVDEAIHIITQFTKKQLRPIQGAVRHDHHSSATTE